MLVLSDGEACPTALRLTVEEARCFSDVFETVKPLAYHSDCCVSLCRCKASGDTMVVKAYIRHNLGDQARRQVMTETQIHSRLNHPNIVPFLLGFEDSQHTYLVVAYADGGDLRQHFGRHVNEAHVRTWLVLPLLLALATVHQQGVVHRDLKPENVLLHGGRLLLADFGMSVCTTGQHASNMAPLTAGGTPLYTAPEVMLAMFRNTGVAHVVGPKNDIWALGLMVLEALAGCHPFSREQAADSNVLYTIAHCSHVNLPSHLSPACQSFLAAALCRDPDHRLDAEALLGHPWLAECLSSADKESGAERPEQPTWCRIAAGGRERLAAYHHAPTVVCKGIESWES